MGMTKPHLPGLTLKQNCENIDDGSKFCLQKLEKEEKLTENDRVVKIQQWFPGNKYLGLWEEAVLDEKMTISDLKIFLAEKAATPCDPNDVRVAKQQYMDGDSHIQNLPWGEYHLKPLNEKTIGGKPWSISSGDYIIYKDTNQANKANQILGGLSEAEIERRRKENVRLGRPKERALKIYTAKEQRERKEQEEKQ